MKASEKKTDAAGRCAGVSKLQARASYLLTSAAIGALAFGGSLSILTETAHAGPDACIVSGATATCSGDQSDGIASGTDFSAPPVDTLDISNLTPAGIAPAAGTDGVNFTSAGDSDVTVNSDTSGSAGINTSGDDAAGIVADVVGDGDATVNSTGDISTGGNGTDDNENASAIFARANGGGAAQEGSVSVTSNGDLSTAGTFSNGIQAEITGGSGSVTVNSSGDITTLGGPFAAGVVGRINGGAGGAISITSQGDLDTTGNALFGQNNVGDGNISIQSQGDIESGGSALFAVQNGGAGDITLLSQGDVDSTDNALFAQNNRGDGAMSITSTGDITSSDGGGLFAQQNGGNGDVTLTSTGDLNTQDTGLFAQQNGGTGAITITSIGDLVTGGGGIGLFGQQNRGAGDVSLTSTGDLSTSGTALFAQINGGEGVINVKNTGNINTTNFGQGIFAMANGSNPSGLTIESNGDISAQQQAIFAQLSGVGSELTITSNGDLSSANNAGLFVQSNAQGTGNVTINSTGDVSGIRDSIFVQRNAGNGDISITTQGDLSATEGTGIFAAQNGGNGDITIVNTGNIGLDGDGILAQQNGGTGDISITTKGDISITAKGPPFVTRTGILAALNRDSGALSIDHEGDIGATGDGIQAALNAGGGMLDVTSKGDITAASGNAINLSSSGPGTIAFNNTGDLTGTIGILVQERTANSAPATISTSGTINGTGGFAIDLRGDASDTVTLNAGTTLIGTIDFGNGNDGLGGTNADDIDTLNIGAGVNGVITFADSQSDSALQSAPEVINAQGGAVLINGGEALVAIDATGFAAQRTFVGDLTTSIFNAVDAGGAIRVPAPSRTQSNGFGGSDSAASGMDVRLWGSFFGGRQTADGSGSVAQHTHNYAGLLTGVEAGNAVDGGVFGLLAGYGNSDLSVTANAGSTDVDTFFGGAYWKRDFGTYRINAAFSVGVTDNETTRNVGGLAANGDYDGVFYSPSLTVEVPVGVVVPDSYFSVRANYVGMWLDGYTETGAAPGLLTVSDRDFSLFNTRVQMAFPTAVVQDDGSNTELTLRVGLDGQYETGSDSVSVNAAGTPTSFSTGFENTVSGFAGFDLTHTSADGVWSVSLSGELQSDLDGTIETLGQVTASFRF
ncbi:MAG: autotransporter domain-containing protein [Pseudomonadota bacterium]